jgi:hypothetical protein
VPRCGQQDKRPGEVRDKGRARIYRELTLRMVQWPHMLQTALRFRRPPIGAPRGCRLCALGQGGTPLIASIGGPLSRWWAGGGVSVRGVRSRARGTGGVQPARSSRGSCSPRRGSRPCGSPLAQGGRRARRGPRAGGKAACSAKYGARSATQGRRPGCSASEVSIAASTIVVSSSCRSACVSREGGASLSVMRHPYNARWAIGISAC